MGLGTVTARAPYLTIAGGFIWDRKKGSDDPNYATQEYTKQDKTTAIRKGAQYGDLSALVVAIDFRTHAQFGDSINVRLQDGEDEFVLSVGMNNKNSQDLMKALLVGDLELPFFLKPYDFVGQNGKRTQGISVRQNGEKLDLKIEGAPSKESDWFKSATKKEIRRFFEDLNDWYRAEVEEKVLPNVKSSSPAKTEAAEVAEKAPKKEKVATKETAPEKEVVEEAPVTVLKMKRTLKAYIKENYPDNTLPTLSKDEVAVWYKLALEQEELPFEADHAEDSNVEEVNEADLDAQLDALN